MAEQLEELALFPLETVLFPFASVQLHVFEDRYREMVSECMEDGRLFGIVLIRSGSETDEHIEPYLVGTAVRIVNLHTYDDGRMDLQVQGEHRFRIRRLDESKPYLTGLVEPVIEGEPDDSPRTDALVLKAREDFQLLVEGLIARPGFNVQVIFPPDPMALSFTIANLLPIENREKQSLLETTDTIERLSRIIPILENQLLEIDDLRSRIYDDRGPRRLTHTDLREWINPN
ncbi:MAG: LON peptidase substrate-binding domain-containing protein [Fimbriimonadaceae bacterium]|nr:LON peptidase substrate-binding domain-containing protein [Fimbriimonadaceae bacterium]